MQKQSEWRKIVIMTWWFGGANYGQTLQAFALGKKLEKYGYLAFYQNYDSEYAAFYRFGGFNPLMCAVDNLDYDGIGTSSIERFRKFDLFIRKHFNMLDFSIHENDVQDAIEKTGCHIILCGGDQIWNPNYRESRSQIYAGFFPKLNLPIISYAPSVGINRIIEDEAKNFFDKFSANIHDFEAISIREESGKRLLEESWERQALSPRKISVVLDPVFLLTGEEWKKIYTEEAVLNGNDCGSYLFAYFVGEKNKDLSIVQKIARHRNLLIKEQMLKEGCGRELSPLEFVRTIAESEFVVSDSYHAAVFSIIFRKQFVMLKRIDSKELHYENDDRLNFLFQTFQIGNRFAQNYTDYKQKEDIAYDSVEAILRQKRNDSAEFLQNALLAANEKIFILGRLRDKRIPYRFPAEFIPGGSKIILYGAGGVGVDFWMQCKILKLAEIVLWVDREERYKEEGICVSLRNQDYSKIEYDICLIAVKNEKDAAEIKEYLIMHRACPEKIAWYPPLENKKQF